MPSLTAAQIAELIQANIQGNADYRVSNITSIQAAKENDITFVITPHYVKYIPETAANIIIISPDLLKAVNVTGSKTFLIVKNPKLSLAKLVHIFYPQSPRVVGIHPSAIIGKNCNIPQNVTIGANCVIEDQVSIGDNTIIEAGSFIGSNVILGKECHLFPKTVIYQNVILKDRVIIHSGVVIGADGFGYAMDQGQWVKIPQVGGVIIGCDVEIGANSTVDRGTLTDTIINDGVKIDNQVQIGHNVIIGKNTIIAGCTGIAGSTEIGANCVIGGGAGIADHLHIVDHVIIGGMGAVGQSIMEPGVYSSGITISKNKEWKRNMLRFHQLDQMFKRIRKLELKYDGNEC